MNAIALLACTSTPPDDLAPRALLGNQAQLALLAADFLLEARNGVDAQIFDSYNAANGTNQITLYDAGWGTSLNPNQYRILVSVSSAGLVTAVRPYGVTGAVTIPSGGYVVAANGTALPYLASYVVGDALNVVSTSSCQPRSVGVPVLLYHDIGSSGAALEAHLSAIQEAGYTTITLDQLQNALNGAVGENGCDVLPANPIVITFDDAYASQFAYAPALLDAYGMVGNFFIITSYPGSVSWVASWSTITDALATYPDNVVLACHSHNAHYQVTVGGKLVAAYMTPIGTETDAQFQKRRLDDMVQCRDVLFDHTGVWTRAIAWPFGSYDQSLTTIAYKVGFETMWNTWPGINVEENDDASANVRRFGGSVTSTWPAIEAPINRWYVCP